MMSGLGKLLQIGGLVVPLLAVFAQLEGRISVGKMLMFLAAAMCMFWIGQIITPREDDQ